MSVRLSVRMKQIVSNRVDFHEILYSYIFRNSVEIIQFSLKSDTNRLNGYFTWWFMHLTKFYWETEMCDTNVVGKIKTHISSYVYRTVHHLDSWVKRDQLDVTCFIISLLNAQHVSDVNTSIFRSLRLMCWVISWVALIWFDVCWSCVVVWLWWCDIRM